jgi:hypothetical protein
MTGRRAIASRVGEAWRMPPRRTRSVRSTADCRQADIDAWYAEHNQHDRNTVRRFLQWCAENKLTRRFTLPSARTGQGSPLTRTHRLVLLGQILTNAGAPTRSRVAAGLLLLYAQPASRIVHLTLDDLIQDGDHVFIRLGNHPPQTPKTGDS